jgi:hypothetical protein
LRAKYFHIQGKNFVRGLYPEKAKDILELGIEYVQTNSGS